VIRISKPKVAPAKLTKDGKLKTVSHLREYKQNLLDYQSGKKKLKFSSDIYGDKSVKKALILAQHKKCCFCERLVGEDGDVEHFRPKSAYCQQRGKKFERPGYYWLAYAWDNLYLSCNSCNQRQKGALFPLLDPQKRAQLCGNNIGIEEPLFIDPGKEEPSLHIGFRGEVPYPVPGSAKGKVTLEVLKLDRSILNDARLVHLQKLKTLYEVIEVAAAKPQDLELQKLAVKADGILQDAISDKGEFAAATRAAFENRFQFIL
jgi:5-methylcytosine-specific restriction endonuclease McrA